MEDIFVNRDGSGYIFGPKNDLWFNIEDINLLTVTELESLALITPNMAETPIIINLDNISEWRKKIRHMNFQKKESAKNS